MKSAFCIFFARGEGKEGIPSPVPLLPLSLGIEFIPKFFLDEMGCILGFPV